MFYRTALIFLLFAGCAFLYAEENFDDLSVGIVLGGEDVVATIKDASSVTAQRIDSIFSKENDQLPLEEQKEPPIVDLAPPLPVSPEVAKKLQTLFTQGATYVAPGKRCRFRANVRYTFHVASEDASVSLVLCFGCGELQVWRKGEMIAFSPFDARYEELLNVTKEIFPQDEFIASFSAESFKERLEKMRQQ